MRSSSSSSSINAVPPPPPARVADDPRATYRSSNRGDKKRLRPNFVPPTIRESMAETYTKPTSSLAKQPVDDQAFLSPISASVHTPLPDSSNDPQATRKPEVASLETRLRSPSPTESVASSTTSELSARSLSRAKDILQRAKDRRKQFWGD